MAVRFCFDIFSVFTTLSYTDLLKHTDKKNPDHTALGLAVDSLKNVMT